MYRITKKNSNLKCLYVGTYIYIAQKWICKNILKILQWTNRKCKYKHLVKISSSTYISMPFIHFWITTKYQKPIEDRGEIVI